MANGTDNRAVPPEWWAAFAGSAATWHRHVVAVPARWLAEFDERCARYHALQHTGRWVSGPASMMGVLGWRHLELDHSRVLAWLLDPRRRHGLGSALLAALFPDMTEQELDDISVTREEGFFDSTGTGRFIDIVVRTRDSVVVLENKVWAGQHGEQLDLYHDQYVNHQGVRFVFLTPGGSRPHSVRPEVKAAWQPMSWRRDVIPTLARVLNARGATASAANDYLLALREEFGA